MVISGLAAALLAQAEQPWVSWPSIPPLRVLERRLRGVRVGTESAPDSASIDELLVNAARDCELGRFGIAAVGLGAAEIDKGNARPDATAVAVARWYAEPICALLDASSSLLQVTFRQLPSPSFAVNGDLLDAQPSIDDSPVRHTLVAFVAIVDDGDAPLSGRCEVELISPPCHGIVQLRGTREGDHRLRVDYLRLGDGEPRVLRQELVRVSFVRNLRRRIQKLEEIEPRLDLLARSLVEAQLEILRTSLDEYGGDVEVRCSELLEWTERVASAADSGGKDASLAPGSLAPWIGGQIAHGLRWTGRFALPRATSPAPVPFLIYLHTLGGTESECFGALGRGALVEAALQRGMGILAPRRTGAVPLEEIVQSASSLLPVDREQLWVIGCGAGGAEALLYAKRQAQVCRGVCLVQSITRVSDPGALVDVPLVLVAVKDSINFLPMTKLSAELERKGLRKVHFIEQTRSPFLWDREQMDALLARLCAQE